MACIGRIFYRAIRVAQAENRGLRIKSKWLCKEGRIHSSRLPGDALCHLGTTTRTPNRHSSSDGALWTSTRVSQNKPASFLGQLTRNLKKHQTTDKDPQRPTHGRCRLASIKSTLNSQCLEDLQIPTALIETVYEPDHLPTWFQSVPSPCHAFAKWILYSGGGIISV